MEAVDIYDAALTRISRRRLVDINQNMVNDRGTIKHNGWVFMIDIGKK